MSLLLLIPGIILLAVNPEWFSGQETVGLVLTIVGAALLVFQLVVFAAASLKIRKINRKVNRSW
jgi:hypothetical protein